MEMLLKLVVLLSATVLTLSASIDKESSIETTSNVENLANLKDEKNDNNESKSTIEYNEQKTVNPDDSPVIKDILNKLDKSDITKVIEEEMSSKTKSSADSMKISEINKSDDNAQIVTALIENQAKEKLLSKTIPKNMILDNAKDKADIIETEETVSKNNKKNSDYSKDIEKQLKDVASAVAEVVTSLPAVPIRPDTPSKYTEVIGSFISELLKIPMVLLHAVSNAIASLTNNKVNIPTQSFLSQATQPPH